ncbi:mucin-2-like [Galleria mellonella]|uniref:Mucin-2-like n=1 Tax=Galleria mellonella TaxID=7137 RepID=A0A6J3CAJ9_GALME|nr:mucin-2-like [Galleria mellonella]
MAVIIKRILYILIINSILFQLSDQTQPVKQYIITGVSPSIQGITKSPAINLGNQNAVTAPNVASLSALLNLLTGSSTLETTSPTLTKPQNAISTTPNMISLSALANLLSTGTPTLEYSYPILGTLKDTQPEPKASNSVDMELLNNMAIALQLMILNNILNSPPEEPAGPEPVVVPGIPMYETREPVTPISISYAPIKNTYVPPPPTTTPAPPVQNQPYHQQNTFENHQTFSMPNSNFVGSSGFADVNPIMTSIKPGGGLGSLNGRTGLTLMSPYEALSPNPFSDPFSPTYSSISSKKDFQSPYTSILQSDNGMDLFSI